MQCEHTVGWVLKMKRTYSELITLPTFKERFDYLKLNGEVGAETFGFDRYLNQKFYHSNEWRTFRRDILIRDMGCDLAMEDRPIYGKILVHHMNPIEVDDILDFSKLMEPEEVVCVSLVTHDAIHYSNENLLLEREPVSRMPNDTIPWRL